MTNKKICYFGIYNTDYARNKNNIIGFKDNDYEVVEINLEADWEVVSKRFEERVKSALANPERRIANLSTERFRELFDIYQNEKNPSAIIFRTDTQSIEEVSGSILKLL